ncbi:hypothetical protein KZ483_19840 [Paenibacillus sp. sptzw28]|uniref:hypothetical protein n=1 Tax=Paenibacillus sp. sptzw28 TaxID=715179 RepID=UPI001C6EBE40|nr:hypothetical protein [Paenibacillus sp. sptzw28]QYR20095.1 hypothetical protein KZ483_19840 [Paenibacillus sp. sptzw28]
MSAIADPIIELLRPVEQLCYQVAHYLLGNDRDAAAASEEALIELYLTPMFVRGSEEERRQLAKAAAMRTALKLAGQSIREGAAK